MLRDTNKTEEYFREFVHRKEVSIDKAILKIEKTIIDTKNNPRIKSNFLVKEASSKDFIKLSINNISFLIYYIF